MRKRLILIARGTYWLSLVLTLLAGTARAQAGAWERVSEEHGIVVERRSVAGTNLKEFRGRAVVDAPLISLLAVFSDVEGAAEWMDKCEASRVVHDGGDLDKVVYNRTGAPWPVSDRDAVVGNQVFFDERQKRVRIEFRAVRHPDSPPIEGVVRMPFLRGHWYLWPQADGKTTRVEYQVHADPGGALPNFLVNYASKELPSKTIAGLAAQAKRNPYTAMKRYIRASAQYRAWLTR
jgi:hypothetical protein